MISDVDLSEDEETDYFELNDSEFILLSSHSLGQTSFWRSFVFFSKSWVREFISGCFSFVLGHIYFFVVRVACSEFRFERDCWFSSPLRFLAFWYLFISRNSKNAVVWKLPRLRSRSKSPLIRPSQTSGTSDQTVPDRSDLWSDENALEDHCALEVRSKPPLIRRVPDRSDPWSDKFQTIVQTSSRPLSRLKCVRNSLIREWF